MKKINFKKITIKNFLSIGEEPVEIVFNKGLHLITGRNKDKPDRQNAVGKSTIADAIYFAIFGETLREIKKDLIINNITGGTTTVQLEFNVNSSRGNNNFVITRTLSPSRVTVEKDGIDKTRDSISNTTKYICEVLSATPAVFQNSVIMTVNNAVPFMAKNKVEKRKFIEDIFGLEVFSKMMSIVRQEYNDLKRDYDIQLSLVNERRNAYNDIIVQRDEYLKKREEKKELYKKRQRENIVELEKLKTQLESDTEAQEAKNIQQEIDNINSKIIASDERLTELIEEKTSKKATVTFKKDIFLKLGTEEQTCPVCLRLIEDHDKTHIQHEKKKLRSEIEDLIDEMKETTSKIQQINNLKERLRTGISEKNNDLKNAHIREQARKNILEKINQIEKWQVELIEDLKALEEETEGFSLKIDVKLKSLNEKEKELQQTTDQLNKLNMVKFVISEEGVKSYIVNKLLDLLNSRLHFYLKKLDSNSICVFDEYFEEQIVNEKNKICSYFNFSGAERKSIDLACLFAFSDIRRMQGGVSYNIAIYDELFDSSFDEKGLEHVVDILKERTTKLDECSMIISHRKESIKTVTGEIIFLEKENGITRRVDFDA